MWIAAALAATLAAAPAPGDPARGLQLYRGRCSFCHTPDANRIGPRHRGVYGARAGTQPGFRYSPPLAASGIVWTAGTLDAWLTDPRRMVPGAAMGQRVPDARDRADLIAYLRSLEVRR